MSRVESGRARRRVRNLMGRFIGVFKTIGSGCVMLLFFVFFLLIPTRENSCLIFVFVFLVHLI